MKYIKINAMVVLVVLLFSMFALGNMYWPKNLYSYIETSAGGECFMKVIPGRIRIVNKSERSTEDPRGIAFRVEKDGSFTELWRLDNWYAFDVYLSRDGQYLVEASGQIGFRPSEEYIAFRFYKNGKLIKQYPTAQLIKNHEVNSHMFSDAGFQWRKYEIEHQVSLPNAPEAKVKLAHRNVFYLKTIDDIMYEFDATSGKFNIQYQR